MSLGTQLAVATLQPADTTTPLLPVLSTKHPPCRVCGGRGAGIHYGVNTCEACKSFFGRCLAKQPRLVCKFTGRCQVAVGSRMCSACRFAKCLTQGMSKHGVKIGRSCYIQVTAAIEEVKRLELQLKLKQDGTLVTADEHLRQMDDVIHRLTDVYVTQIPRHNPDIPAMEQQYIVRRQLEEQLYGPRRMLTRSAYNEIYEQTQLDVDGRREKLQTSLPAIEKVLLVYTSFITFVPGVKRMSKNDQRKLLAGALLEAEAFLLTEFYNVDHGLFTCPHDNSIIINIEQFGNFGDDLESGEFSKFLTLLRRIQMLDLTEEESALSSALCILLADADLSPIGHNIASANADYVSEALVKVISRNHEAEENVFAKIVAIITEMREPSARHRMNSKNMLADIKDFGLPADILDMFSFS